MGHHHHNQTDNMGRRLLLTMLINLLIPVLQFAGGIAAGSIALISDALHNLGDFTALLIAFAAHKASKRGPSFSHTFGLRRLEAFAAVINAVLLGGAASYIAIEAIRRMAQPMPVASTLVAGLALVGIIGNGISAWLLHKDSEKSLNARGSGLRINLA